MMSGIRGRNTKPEILIRSQLHRRGFRFRLHPKGLPGKPDIVFPRYGAVLFVHGCFWHGHDCPLFKWPKTRENFWREKISRNRLNDQKVMQALVDAGWRIALVRECSIRGSGKDINGVADRIACWLRGEEQFMEIRG